MSLSAITFPTRLAASAIYNLPPVSTVRHILNGSENYNSLIFRVKDAALTALFTYLALATHEIISQQCSIGEKNTLTNMGLTAVLGLGITNIPVIIWHGNNHPSQPYSSIARRAISIGLIIGTTYSAYQLSPTVTPYLKQAFAAATWTYGNIAYPVFQKTHQCFELATPYIQEIGSKFASTAENLPPIAGPLMEKISQIKDGVFWTIENIGAPVIQKAGQAVWTVGKAAYTTLFG